MKKVLIYWLALIVGLGWLNSCASVPEIVKKDGQGNVQVYQSFLNSIKKGNSNEPYHYSSNPNCLANGKLGSDVYDLEKASDDYALAEGMEDSVFYAFQTKLDDAKNVSELLWVFQVTAEPMVDWDFLGRENLLGMVVKDEKKEAVGGMSEEIVKQYIIRAVRMGPWHDKYLNVDDRYAKDSRYVITWDKDAFYVEYLKQTNEYTAEITQTSPVEDNETIEFKQTRRIPGEITKVGVVPGENEAIIDIHKGSYINLCQEVNGQEIAVKINPYKEKDLILDGLVAVTFGKEYWLKIITQPVPEKLAKPEKPAVRENKVFDFEGKISPIISPVKKTYKPKISRPVDNKVKKSKVKPKVPSEYNVKGTMTQRK